MNNKYTAGAVSFSHFFSFARSLFLLAFALVSFSIIPAQHAAAQVATTTCPVGWVCTPATSTPVITSISPNPISVGQTLTITGQNLYTLPAAMNIYIDNALLTTGASFLANGTTDYFTLPAIANGYHTLYVTNGNGTSNTVSFLVQGQSTGTSTPATDATVTATAVPYLSLSYDRSQKESQLTATFGLTVNGGTNGINIDPHGVGVSFINQTSNSAKYSYPDSESVNIVAPSSVKTVTDSYGRTLFAIPAGQNVRLQVIATVNPQQLFAGTYYAALGTTALAEVGTNNEELSLPIAGTISTAQTNTRTIVGEFSPYISSVTNPATVGQTFTINGQRLNGGFIKAARGSIGKSTVVIDGTPVTSSVSFANNGTSATFTLPASVLSTTNIAHGIYINNSITGQSNTVYFNLTGSTTPISSPSININGQPTLALTYDSTHKESALTATFNISVNGGSNGVNLVQGTAGVQLDDSQALPVNFNQTSGTLNPTSVVAVTTDSVGQTLYVVPAGQSANFQVTEVMNPQELFAGAYAAGLYAISANPGTSINNQYALYANPKILTNSVTIIGELSPYISSVTSPIAPGQTMNVTGQRLGTSAIQIDGVNVSFGHNTPSVSVDGTNASFTFPSNISPGPHYLTFVNSTNGASNKANFLVGSGTTSPATSTPVVGTVTASLDPSSPQSAVLSTNQTSVTLAVIDLKAGPTLSVSNLNGIQLASDSTGAAVDLQNIKVYAGPTLLGTASSLVSNGSYYYQWINVSGFTIPANTSVPLRLVADIPNTATAGQVRLGIAGLNFASPGAYTSGFPVYGATMSLGSASTTPAATITATLDSSSPQQGIIQTSVTAQTQNVLLGVYDIKSQNINATLRGLVLSLNTTGASVGSTFGVITLKTGNAMLGSGVIANGSANTSTVTFGGGFNLPLPANTYVPVSVWATVNAGVNGVSAYTSLQPTTGNIIAVDPSGNTVTVVPATSPLTTAAQSFVLAGGQLSNETFSITNPQLLPNGSFLNLTQFSGSFTITAGSAPIYIASNPQTALAWKTVVNGVSSQNLSATIPSFAPANGIQSYDSSNYYQINPGSSRTFTLNGILTNSATTNFSASVFSVGIATVYIGSSPSALQQTPITTGLTGLNSDYHISVNLGASQASTTLPATSTPPHTTPVPVAPSTKGGFQTNTSNIFDAIGSWFSSLFQ